MRHSTPIPAMALVAALALMSAATALDARGPHQPAPPAADAENALANPGAVAPLLEGMGDYEFPVSTGHARAQKFINQAMVLAFGFNHAEAARSFREAQRLDPGCGMAYWGEAWVLGPNINAPMLPENVPLAWAALQKAREHLALCTPREQDYIRALQPRYAESPPEDRAPLNMAFAASMRDLAAKYPEDLDAQVLFAEALMDTMPWRYWDEKRSPREATNELLATLERVLARRPEHPHANHLYIHAVEAAHPEWALACANRLASLCPGAGHLVHMPSHIYIRVGRYHDAIKVNELGTAADDAYVAQCHAQGLYPIAYVPHNHHFIWFAACMLGQKERALHTAEEMAHHVDPDVMRMPGMTVVQHGSLIPLYSYVRFGEWERVRATPQPAEDLVYPRGIWHFAQGMARVRNGDIDAAKAELKHVETLAARDDVAEMFIFENNSAKNMLQIAEQILAGEIAHAAGDRAAALGHLQKAVRIEDALVYEEPPSWYAPTRLTLAAVLLEYGDAAQAETLYREDLAKYPANGWSLWGLQQALTAQGKHDAAAAVESEFKQAWSDADITLTTTRP